MKTEHERVVEIVNIKKQIRSLDLEEYIKENVPEIEIEFRTFIKTGQSYSSNYKLKEFDRILEMVLTNTKSSFINLKYKKFN